MEDRREGTRGDGWIAVVLGLAYLGLYSLTLCPVVYWYDSAEFVTAAFTLGIPHPPGYPLYTLIGHVFTWLPIDPALAINWMSAVFAAVTVGLTFLICRRLGIGRAPSLVGAATLGGGKLFWANAVVAEVYCPGLAFTALVFYLLLKARDESRLGPTFLAAWVAGLGMGVHMSIATLGLGFALLVWAHDTPIDTPSDLRRLVHRDDVVRRLGRGLSAFGMTALGSLIFLYLPLRAAQSPPLNFGNPSSWDRFKWVVSGGTYKGWFVNDLGTAARLGALFEAFREQLLLVGVAVAVVGVLWLWRRRPLECLAMLLMAIGNVGFFFRYEVHDLAVFFLPTTMLACCFVAAGAHALIWGIGRVVTAGRARAMRRLVTAALLAFAFVLAVGNYRAVDMSHFSETEQYIDSMVSELPEGAIVLNFTTPPEWKLDAVFGMYTQKVLGARADVEVVNVVARGPAVVGAAFASGRPVFAYVPVPILMQRFALEPDGPVFRVLPRSASSP
ncbi:MAG: DUF2723 domain-containing protein [Myxococcota bacterium]